MIYSVGDPAQTIYNQPYHQAVQAISNQGNNLIMTVQRGGDSIIESTGFQKQPSQPTNQNTNNQPSVIKRTVRMERPNQNTSWGFQIFGGRDFGQPLLISKVTSGSMAQQVSILTSAVSQLSPIQLHSTTMQIANLVVIECTGGQARAVRKGTLRFFPFFLELVPRT